MSVVIRNDKELQRAKEDYEALHEAWRKALLAQSYSQGSDQISRANVNELHKQMQEYQAAIGAYESNGSVKRRTGRFVPLG